MPIPASIMASFTSSSVRHTAQRYRYSSGGGPKGSSSPSFGGGPCFLRRIFASFDRFKFVIEHAIRRMPELPYPHLMLTVCAEQGVTARALPVALAVRQRCDDLDP